MHRKEKVALGKYQNEHPTYFQAAIAQLGERQTEDLKVPGSIPGRGIIYSWSRNDFVKKGSM